MLGLFPIRERQLEPIRGTGPGARALLFWILGSNRISQAIHRDPDGISLGIWWDLQGSHGIFDVPAIKR